MVQRMAKASTKTKRRRATTVPATKVERWNFRVANEANDLVRRAASTSHRTLSEFVLQAAINEAEHVLADRTHFMLDKARWDAFVSLLDRPAEANPRLAQLFEKPSVFV